MESKIASLVFAKCLCGPITLTRHTTVGGFADENLAGVTRWKLSLQLPTYVALDVKKEFDDRQCN